MFTQFSIPNVLTTNPIIFQAFSEVKPHIVISVPLIIEKIIKKRSTELTRKQYMVAKYMIDHPDEMAYITLKELSQNIGVTEITILNTCASLGYEGFTQIKYEFRKDIIQKQKTDVLDDSSVYTEKVSKYEHDNREKVLSEIGDEEVKAITDYWQNIDLKKYFEAADLILNSKQIFICGSDVNVLRTVLTNTVAIAQADTPRQFESQVTV